MKKVVIVALLGLSGCSAQVHPQVVAAFAQQDKNVESLVKAIQKLDGRLQKLEGKKE